jgi:eukaryotic-like serine/threonine-protein kinase
MSKGKHPFFWIVLFAATLIASLYIAVGTVIYKYGALEKDLGWKARVESGNFLVQTVDPGGYASGRLQKGDRILSVNGLLPIDVPGLMGPQILQSGEYYKVRILRDGVESELQLRAKIQKSSRNLFPVLIPIVSSLVFFVIALVIGLAKPDQRFTQLFTFTWFSVALIYMALALEPLQMFFGKSELNLAILIWLLSFSPLEIATAYHFCYRFPPGVPEGKFWSLLRNFLYVWAGTITILFTCARVGLLLNFNSTAQFLSKHHQFPWFPVVMIFSLTAICALLIRNHIRIREADQRRRLRWVLFGALVGAIPTVVFFVANLAINTAQLNWWFTNECLYYLSMISNIALELIPLSIGYAIVRDRMFDIQVVVRQGLRYLFAKNVLRILIYLPAVIILTTIVKNRDKRILDLLFSNTVYILLTIAAIIGLKFRNQLSDLLDRKFFREAYNSEKILISLIEEVKNLNSISEVSKWVTLQLDSALHPKQILVFYRKKGTGDLALGYSSGEHPQGLTIPRESRFLRVAETIPGARQFPSKETGLVPENEMQWLYQLGIHLIVPMNDSDQRLVGLLLLGEKKSEEPYSATDRKMLDALAGQIAVICENLLLKEHADQESRIKREVLSHLQDQNRNLVKECPDCGRCYDSSASNCDSDHNELILTLPVDRIVDGKYRLEKLLGRGGMGAVYNATDLRLNREVAIKVLIGSMFGDRVALRRFEREAQASAKLNHPNIITVYDFGGIEGEGAYLVMELLFGFTLRPYLAENGNLTPLVAADWLDQILEGMKVAHQNGVIHRDLKPENILITRGADQQSRIKILDFGLAKLKFLDKVESKSLTAPGTVIGTLSYMSPEQIMGGEIDERTDLFSLGVMAIEMLTGHQPFTGQTFPDVALSILTKPFELKGELPEIRTLNSVLQRCIAKNKMDRYESVEKLQKDLIEAIRNVPPFPSINATPDQAVSSVQTRIAL